ncbi:hypothetical protein BDR03DRAFT_971174 [Suillus americanus]|nr:hypothetical protein BDR03DRAFT_971174 [Suillus americanus]
MTRVMIHLGLDIEHCSKWNFLRQSRWTKVKVLYITARYLPFILISMYLYRALISSSIVNLPDNELTCCISVNFTPETPNVCGRTPDSN